MAMIGGFSKWLSIFDTQILKSTGDPQGSFFTHEDNLGINLMKLNF